MWWENLLFTLLGGILGLLPLLLQYILKKKGKFEIYAKAYYFGEVCLAINNRNFIVPIMIDFVNTKGEDQIVRDIQLYAYNKGERIKAFDIADKSKSKEGQELYGDKGFYSINVKAKNIYSCKFLFSMPICDIEIDELVLSYWNNKNKEILLHYINMDGKWVCKEDNIPFEWIKLEGINKKGEDK